MSNVRIAIQLIENLVDQGVRRFCVCAGARNAPLIEVLDRLSVVRPELWVKSFFDERAAGFFALGMSKYSMEPVAVLTTSGTAVAELLPAAIEAHYSGLPLVFLTADRPRAFRGSGAPQAIEQCGIFSYYASQFYDIENIAMPVQISRQGLTHINVCFAEPLIDEPIEPILNFSEKLVESANERPGERSKSVQRVAEFFEKVKRPLAIVSGISLRNRGSVAEFLTALKAPVYVEAPSGLREHQGIANWQLRTGTAALSARAFENYFDGVLRIGSVPTLRLWRDFDLQLRQVPVLSVHDLPFSGLSRDPLPALSYSDFFFAYSQIVEQTATLDKNSSALTEDARASGVLENLLDRLNGSEASFVRKLSEAISSSAMVFLGNSLPIREWDLAASWTTPHVNIFANRGANGIDGLISTFLGAAAVSNREENWLILGDLSALYDLNALANAGDMKVRVVVINNRGGQIFSRLFSGEKFLNAHKFSFENWARMFDFDYLRLGADTIRDDWAATIAKLEQRAVIELLPDNGQSNEFWREWGAL